MNDISLDSIDLLLLDQLQKDASLSNQALAERVHVSPATCLRRVRLLRENGLLESVVGILNPERLAQVRGAGLTAIAEVTLERQGAEFLQAFEDRVIAHDQVQQCYRVSPGPDFVLVLYADDMPAYLALSQQLFTSDANVRNVKSFFSLKRAKFGARVALAAPRPA